MIDSEQRWQFKNLMWNGDYLYSSTVNQKLLQSILVTEKTEIMLANKTPPIFPYVYGICPFSINVRIIMKREKYIRKRDM